MLESLQFVQGAVAKKDFVPSLTHFHIAGGRIRGYNGSLALCSPIELDLEVTPKAVPFIKAIQTCKGTVQLNMATNGKLFIKSGKFKAHVDCTTEVFPDIQPEGEVVELQPGLIKALRVLAPFIAEDASRPWARGILFRGNSAFATNNIIVLEYWLGEDFPVEVNIPRSAVLELLRIAEDPTSLQMSEDSVTFHYPGDRWMRTQTYSTVWPDLGRVLDKEATPTKLPEGFFPALVDLVPFIDDLSRIFFTGDAIATSGEAGEGASVEVPGTPATGIYHLKQLQLLEGLVEKADFTLYPSPSLFYGDKVRGAIIGMRK